MSAKNSTHSIQILGQHVFSVDIEHSWEMITNLEETHFKRYTLVS